MRLTKRNTLSKRWHETILADSPIPIALAGGPFSDVDLSFYGDDDATRYRLTLTRDEATDLRDRLSALLRRLAAEKGTY